METVDRGLILLIYVIVLVLPLASLFFGEK